jgi:formylglycine-generating enzyme required for sulfatase activity
LGPGVFSLGGRQRFENSTARLSAFYIDDFEVTVGRFHRFVDAYDAWRRAGNPRADDGALPSVEGSGWQSDWDALLPASAAEFETKLQSNVFFTYGSAVSASTLPINYVSWEEAFAFCLWDNARLATNAEYEYATFGGDEYRPYPWGSAPIDADHAVYGCLGNGNPDMDITDILPVGSKRDGVSRWGQYDLLGSVNEHVFDFFGTYPSECDDCAITTGQYRVHRGGNWADPPDFVSSTRVDYSVDQAETPRRFVLGLRCARSTE